MYQERELEPSRVETDTPGSGSGQDVESITKRYPSEHPDVRAYLDITAGGGGAMTLDIDIIGVVNGVRYVIASFPQQTVAAQVQLLVPNCPSIISHDFVVAGTTPTYTYNLRFTRH